MERSQRTTIAAVIALFVLFSNFATLSALTPTLVNYQGRLLDSGGNPVADGNYSVVFTIYDAVSGGATIWTESRTVTTIGGDFTILLGSVTPITDAVFSSATRYLGVKVGADPEISPRTRLVSQPYAFRVNTIDGATGGAVSGNISLDNSTASVGNVYKGGQLFLHNFGLSNLFIGTDAGNLTMSGSGNVCMGVSPLKNNLTGVGNVAVGVLTLDENLNGSNNAALGNGALGSNTDGQNNSALGTTALGNNQTSSSNTAVGFSAAGLTTGGSNTAVGSLALQTNTTGSNNTALGRGADVSANNLTNATAIGYNAVVSASNKVRIGNSSVTVIEGQVAFTFPSDVNQKENFQEVNHAEVLRKLADLRLSSWNYKGHDPQQFRHYGPTAQDFFAAFGNDGIGAIGSPTTINSGDMAGVMLIAIQALKREKDALTQRLDTMQAELEALKREKQK